MYPTAFLLAKPPFIGIWLALKVAGQWSWWSVSHKDDEKVHEGRRRYYQSLIGNAMSVMVGLLTYAAVLIFAAC
jgi:hypothetical protein